eukprot:scaffold9686_cov24-Tisochrysis_lutea.AAC.1
MGVGNAPREPSKAACGAPGPAIALSVRRGRGTSVRNGSAAAQGASGEARGISFFAAAPAALAAARAPFAIALVAAGAKPAAAGASPGLRFLCDRLTSRGAGGGSKGGRAGGSMSESESSIVWAAAGASSSAPIFSGALRARPDARPGTMSSGTGGTVKAVSRAFSASRARARRSEICWRTRCSPCTPSVTRAEKCRV